jgi:hypothetical protein
MWEVFREPPADAAAGLLFFGLLELPGLAGLGSLLLMAVESDVGIVGTAEDPGFTASLYERGEGWRGATSEGI